MEFEFKRRLFTKPPFKLRYFGLFFALTVVITIFLYTFAKWNLILGEKGYEKVELDDIGRCFFCIISLWLCQ